MDTSSDKCEFRSHDEDLIIDKINRMFDEERRIDSGFEKWWSQHDPSARTGRFDKHIERCAFHAGVKFQTGELFKD